MALLMDKFESDDFSARENINEIWNFGFGYFAIVLNGKQLINDLIRNPTILEISSKSFVAGISHIGKGIFTYEFNTSNKEMKIYINEIDIEYFRDKEYQFKKIKDKK